MSIFDEIIFDNKTFGDLLKEIHVKSGKKEKIIKGLINELKVLINDLGDATLIVPLLANYLDISIKNDDQLIKLTGIIQRHLSKASKDTENEFSLTEEEKKQLLENAKSM